MAERHEGVAKGHELPPFVPFLASYGSTGGLSCSGGAGYGKLREDVEMIVPFGRCWVGKGAHTDAGLSVR